MMRSGWVMPVGYEPTSARSGCSHDRIWCARDVRPQASRAITSSQVSATVYQGRSMTQRSPTPSHRNDARFSATPEKLSELDEVNRAVNKAVEPATDLEVYGVNELWTLPENKGDCEDFALLKRRILMERGWPASALLLTVVRDEKNEGHAILTARTSQGDFVLDNKTDDVRIWNKTPYHFVMRQSYINPRVWVSLDPSDAATPSSLAGVQANPQRE